MEHVLPPHDQRALAGGSDKAELLKALDRLTPEEVAGLCGLPLQQAVLAKEREYDEPFVVLDPDRAEAAIRMVNNGYKGLLVPISSVNKVGQTGVACKPKICRPGSSRLSFP